MKKIYLVYASLCLTLIFPAIGLILTLIVYFATTLKGKGKKILIFNMAYSYSLISFSFARISNSGDVASYALGYYNIQSRLNNYGEVIQTPYEKLYYLWNSIEIIFAKNGFDFRYFQAFIIFLIVYLFLCCILTIAKKVNFKKNIDKRLIAIFILFNPMMMLFTQYHNLLAFVISFMGLYFIFSGYKIFGYIILFLAVLIHPAAYIIVFVYLISLFWSINKKVLISMLFLSLFLSVIVSQLPFEAIIPNKMLASKVEFYFTSEWTKYKWSDPGEWLYLYKMVILLTLVFFIGLNIEKYSIHNSFFKKYNRFILWYILLAIMVISYRSVAMRVITLGLIFFIPLIYQFIVSSKKKNIVLVILTFLLFDPRFFLSPFYYDNIYKIGRGFPYNLFESTYQILTDKEYIYEYRI